MNMTMTGTAAHDGRDGQPPLVRAAVDLANVTSGRST
jgi:hypothetical protein